VGSVKSVFLALLIALLFLAPIVVAQESDDSKDGGADENPEESGDGGHSLPTDRLTGDFVDPDVTVCPLIYQNGGINTSHPQNSFILDPWGCYFRLLDRILTQTVQTVMRLLP
jgi:hypothetical protein